MGLKVYLAGPIRGLTFDEAVDWRRYAASWLADLGHVSVSPMRGKDYLKDRGRLLGDRGSGSFEEFPMSSEQGIYGRDIFDVSRCDVLLANLEGATKLSIGTVMEIQAARDRGKYVLVVLEDGSTHDHPFVRRAASLVVPNLDLALEVLAVLGDPYSDPPEDQISIENPLRVPPQGGV